MHHYPCQHDKLLFLKLPAVVLVKTTAHLPYGVSGLFPPGSLEGLSNQPAHLILHATGGMWALKAQPRGQMVCLGAKKGTAVSDSVWTHAACG